MIKILTPQQMFSRLPTSLAQLKAGKNSEKIKNEIRQLLDSLYSSKRVVQKTAEATRDLIGNEIADKITSAGKSKSKEKEDKTEEIYIPPEKRQQIIDDLR